jgi:hypothetical protein
MKFYYKLIIYLFTILFVFNSCEKKTIIPKDTVEPGDNIHDYIFLGHIYKSSTRIDERIEYMDLSVFDQIWLGGDICSETTADINTVKYLDNMFDLGSSTTHWSLGNHDVRNGNVNWITDRTGRPTFYVTQFDGIVLLVLNTSFYNSTSVNSQYELIQNVCDTISESSHLILLSHNMVWNNVDQITNVNEFANSDYYWYRFHYDPIMRYLDGVYPKLVEVRKRGVKVIHIAGDFGQKSYGYQNLTSDGIQFIGSGITSNTDYNNQFPTAGQPDSILVLHHDISNRSINWTFEVLL